MKPTLIMIHFAGGNSYSYQPFLEYLKDFNVVRLELPGRGKRSREPLITDSESAVEDILGQILKIPGLSGYAIYGHSMGAILGFKVARLLAHLKLPPKCLIVSGNPGPGVIEKNGIRLFDLPKDRLIEEVKRLGGTSDLILSEAAVFDYFEPILRADFQVVETGGMQLPPVLNIPIFAAMGDEEPLSGDINTWGKYTSARFSSKIFSGHHFFINNHPAGICRFIREAYDYCKSM